MLLKQHTAGFDVLEIESAVYVILLPTIFQNTFLKIDFCASRLLLVCIHFNAVKNISLQRNLFEFVIVIDVW